MGVDVSKLNSEQGKQNHKTCDRCYVELFKNKDTHLLNGKNNVDSFSDCVHKRKFNEFNDNIPIKLVSFQDHSKGGINRQNDNYCTRTPSYYNKRKTAVEVCTCSDIHKYHEHGIENNKSTKKIKVPNYLHNNLVKHSSRTTILRFFRKIKKKSRYNKNDYINFISSKLISENKFTEIKYNKVLFNNSEQFKHGHRSCHNVNSQMLTSKVVESDLNSNKNEIKQQIEYVGDPSVINENKSSHSERDTIEADEAVDLSRHKRNESNVSSQEVDKVVHCTLPEIEDESKQDSNSSINGRQNFTNKESGEPTDLFRNGLLQLLNSKHITNKHLNNQENKNYYDSISLEQLSHILQQICHNKRRNILNRRELRDKLFKTYDNRFNKNIIKRSYSCKAKKEKFLHSSISKCSTTDGNPISSSETSGYLTSNYSSQKLYFKKLYKRPTNLNLEKKDIHSPYGNARNKFFRKTLHDKQFTSGKDLNNFITNKINSPITTVYTARTNCSCKESTQSEDNNHSPDCPLYKKHTDTDGKCQCCKCTQEAKEVPPKPSTPLPLISIYSDSCSTCYSCNYIQPINQPRRSDVRPQSTFFPDPQIPEKEENNEIDSNPGSSPEEEEDPELQNYENLDSSSTSSYDSVVILPEQKESSTTSDKHYPPSDSTSPYDSETVYSPSKVKEPKELTTLHRDDINKFLFDTQNKEVSECTCTYLRKISNTVATRRPVDKNCTWYEDVTREQYNKCICHEPLTSDRINESVEARKDGCTCYPRRSTITEENLFSLDDITYENNNAKFDENNDGCPCTMVENSHVRASRQILEQSCPCTVDELPSDLNHNYISTPLKENNHIESPQIVKDVCTCYKETPNSKIPEENNEINVHVRRSSFKESMQVSDVSDNNCNYSKLTNTTTHVNRREEREILNGNYTCYNEEAFSEEVNYIRTCDKRISSDYPNDMTEVLATDTCACSCIDLKETMESESPPLKESTTPVQITSTNCTCSSFAAPNITCCHKCLHRICQIDLSKKQNTHLCLFACINCEECPCSTSVNIGRVHFEVGDFNDNEKNITARNRSITIEERKLDLDTSEKTPQNNIDEMINEDNLKKEGQIAPLAAQELTQSTPEVICHNINEEVANEYYEIEQGNEYTHIRITSELSKISKNIIENNKAGNNDYVQTKDLFDSSINNKDYIKADNGEHFETHDPANFQEEPAKNDNKEISKPENIENNETNSGIIFRKISSTIKESTKEENFEYIEISKVSDIQQVAVNDKEIPKKENVERDGSNFQKIPEIAEENVKQENAANEIRSSIQKHSNNVNKTPKEENVESNKINNRPAKNQRSSQIIEKIKEGENVQTNMTDVYEPVNNYKEKVSNREEHVTFETPLEEGTRKSFTRPIRTKSITVYETRDLPELGTEEFNATNEEINEPSVSQRRTSDYYTGYGEPVEKVNGIDSSDNANIPAQEQCCQNNTISSKGRCKCLDDNDCPDFSIPHSLAEDVYFECFDDSANNLATILSDFGLYVYSKCTSSHGGCNVTNNKSKTFSKGACEKNQQQCFPSTSGRLSKQKSHNFFKITRPRSNNKTYKLDFRPVHHKHVCTDHTYRRGCCDATCNNIAVRNVNHNQVYSSTPRSFCNH